MLTTTTWTSFGPWYHGPAAPNGSVQGIPERRATTYTLFSADYYGHGEKLYLEVAPYLHYLLHGKVCITRLAGSQDGDPQRIRRIMETAGVTLC